MTGSESRIFPGVAQAAPGAQFLTSLKKRDAGARRKYAKYKSEIERETDVTGKRFAPLTVVRRLDTLARERWVCRCDCGAEIVLRFERIKRRRGCASECPLRRAYWSSLGAPKRRTP